MYQSISDIRRDAPPEFSSLSDDELLKEYSAATNTPVHVIKAKLDQYKPAETRTAPKASLTDQLYRKGFHSLEQTRQQLPSLAKASDEEVIRALSSNMGVDPIEMAKTFGYETGDEKGLTASALSSAVDELQAIGYSVIGGASDLVDKAVDAEWTKQVRDWANENADQEGFEAYLNSRQDLGRVEDIDSLGMAAEFAWYQLVKQVPVLTALVGAQFIPGLGQVAAGTAAAGRAVGLSAKAAQAVGGAVAAAPASTVYGFGSLYQSSVEGGNPDSVKAAMLSPLYGLAESIIPGFVGGALKGGKFSGTKAVEATKGFFGGAFAEGGTELAQTAMEIEMRDDLKEEEKLSMYLNAVVIGSGFGGTVGVTTGALKGKSKALIAEEAETEAALAEEARAATEAKVETGRTGAPLERGDEDVPTEAQVAAVEDEAVQAELEEQVQPEMRVEGEIDMAVDETTEAAEVPELQPTRTKQLSGVTIDTFEGTDTEGNAVYVDVRRDPTTGQIRTINAENADGLAINPEGSMNDVNREGSSAAAVNTMFGTQFEYKAPEVEVDAQAHIDEATDSDVEADADYVQQVMDAMEGNEAKVEEVLAQEEKDADDALNATNASEVGTAAGRANLKGGVLAAIARSLTGTTSYPLIIFKPKSVQHDTEQTAQHMPQMRAIVDAVQGVQEAFDAYMKANKAVPSEKTKSIERQEAARLAGTGSRQRTESDATKTAEKMGVGLDEAKARLSTAMDNFIEVAGGEKNAEAVVAAVKKRAQRLTTRPLATVKVDADADRLLSQPFAWYKDGQLADHTSHDIVNRRETRLSREQSDRGGYQSPHQKASEGQSRRPNGAGTIETGIYGILARINAHGTTYEQTLASAILKAMHRLDEGGRRVKWDWAAEGESARYVPKTNTIYIHENATSEEILHETLHAALQWYVYYDPTDPSVENLKAAVQRLLDYDFEADPNVNTADPHIANALKTIETIREVRASGKKGAELNAVLELISYGASMSDMRKLLKLIPSTQNEDAPGLIRTIYVYLNKLVQRLLGVSNTVANDVIANSLELLEGAANASEIKWNNGATLEQAASDSNLLDTVDYREGRSERIKVLGQKHIFKLLGEDFLPNLTDKWGSKIGEYVREHLPSLEIATRYLNSNFGIPQNVRDLFDMFKYNKNVGYQLMERLAMYVERMSPEQVKTFMAYMDDDTTISNHKDAKELMAIADDVKQFRKRYLETMPPEVQSYFNTYKFSEALLHIQDKKSIATHTFGERISSLIKGVVLDMHKVDVDQNREWMGDDVGNPPNYQSGRFYEVLQQTSDGTIHAGFISEERVRAGKVPMDTNANGSLKYTVDPNERIWVSEGVRDNGTMRMRTNKTLGEAMKDENSSQKIADAMRNTMHALAMNYASKSLSEGMAGYNKGTADAVVFDNLEEANAASPFPNVSESQVITISRDESKSHVIKREMRVSGSFVRVPSGEAYGAMADKIVPGPVWAALNDTTSREPITNMEGYNAFMRYFKKSKTVYNPGTHVTNVATNVTLMMMHEIDFRTFAKAAKIFTQFEAASSTLDPKELQIMRDFMSSGAMLGNFSSAEVKRALYQGMAKNIRQGRHEKNMFTRLSAMMGYEAEKAAMMNKLGRGAKRADEWATEVYAAEDNIFRLAAFIKNMGDMQTAQGGTQLTQQQIINAGKKARKDFLDYDIDSAAVKWSRQSILPFVSWTYAIVPVISRIAVQKPWVMFNLMASYYVLEMAMAGLAGDDDESRRAFGSDELQERLLPGLPMYGTIRIPFLENDRGEAIYYRLGDYVPMAAVIKGSANGFAGLPNYPSGMTPSGPLIALYTAALGVDEYTRESFHKSTNTAFENFSLSLGKIADVFLPPLVGSRNRDRIANEIWGDKVGVTGETIHWPRIARMVGLKFYGYRDTEQAEWNDIIARKTQREFQSAIKQLERDFIRDPDADYDELHSKTMDLLKRMEERLAKDYGYE